jgi:hypothetical protein
VANITAGGVTTFCEGSNVVLNGNSGAGYAYQWYKDGSAIAGATGTSYTATQTGNYTVKVYAGSSCESTSPVVAVTVNPSPNASISSGTPTSFCAGGSVNLNASTGSGYSYQWYKDGSAIGGANAASYNASIGGNYSVVTSMGSCSKTSGNTTVTVWANPTVTTSPSSSTIEKFQTKTITAAGASSYNWNAQTDVVSSGGNNAVFKPLTTTTYTIQGTDANGCKGTSSFTILVIGCGDVTDITATSYSPSRVILRWNNPEGATSDTLRYRKAGATEWIKLFVTGEEYTLNGLEPGVKYEYTITPLCSTTSVFIPSVQKDFTTPSLSGDVYIRLYPNPVTSVSSLEVITTQPKKMQVSIFDNAGRRVMNVSNEENLPAGQVIKSVQPF